MASICAAFSAFRVNLNTLTLTLYPTMSKEATPHVSYFPMMSILSYLGRFLPWKRSGTSSAKLDTPNTNTDDLPPPPRELLRGREFYEIPILRRRIDREVDTPLAALYRLYEHIMLDQNIAMRNELEAFWFQPSWLVCEIPDPKDPDPERYAVLAVIPALLVLAFNRRIELGLPRDAPAIFTRDQLDEWRAREREYEKEPDWASCVPPCKQLLKIPHWNNDLREFVSIDGFDDHRASQEFAKKNILIWQPHIQFI